jgi:hypothetical protein
MQEVLVDRGQLVGQHLIQVLNDFLVALHGKSLPSPVRPERMGYRQPLREARETASR